MDVLNIQFLSELIVNECPLSAHINLHHDFLGDIVSLKLDADKLLRWVIMEKNQGILPDRCGVQGF